MGLKLAATALILWTASALPSAVVADGSISICRNLKGMVLNAPGGMLKSGWTTSSFADATVELWVRSAPSPGGSWDIVTTNSSGSVSYQATGCQVTMRPADAEGNLLDILVVGYCPEHIDTFLFFTRSGERNLLMTSTLFKQAMASSSIYQGECKDAAAATHAAP